jgi:hypothetical protein
MEGEYIIYMAYLKKKIGTILSNYRQLQMEQGSTTLRMWPRTNKLVYLNCDDGANHVASFSEPCDKVWVKEKKRIILLSCKRRV